MTSHHRCCCGAGPQVPTSIDLTWFSGVRTFTNNDAGDLLNPSFDVQGQTTLAFFSETGGPAFTTLRYNGSSAWQQTDAITGEVTSGVTGASAFLYIATAGPFLFYADQSNPPRERYFSYGVSATSSPVFNPICIGHRGFHVPPEYGVVAEACMVGDVGASWGHNLERFYLPSLRLRERTTGNGQAVFGFA